MIGFDLWWDILDVKLCGPIREFNYRRLKPFQEIYKGTYLYLVYGVYIVCTGIFNGVSWGGQSLSIVAASRMNYIVYVQTFRIL